MFPDFKGTKSLPYQLLLQFHTTKLCVLSFTTQQRVSENASSCFGTQRTKLEGNRSDCKDLQMCVCLWKWVLVNHTTSAAQGSLNIFAKVQCLFVDCGYLN